MSVVFYLWILQEIHIVVDDPKCIPINAGSVVAPSCGRADYCTKLIIPNLCVFGLNRKLTNPTSSSTCRSRTDREKDQVVAMYYINFPIFYHLVP